MSERPKSIAILGSTGSIGRNALEVIAACPERFTVTGLAAGDNIELLAAQIRALRPLVVSVRDPAALARLRALLAGFTPLPAMSAGPAGLRAVAVDAGAAVVVAATVGVAALAAIHAAIENGADIALANKEALVVAGRLLMAAAARRGVAIVPIDSEHSAIHQCLRGGARGEMARLILTASGGPFLRLTAAELEHVSAAQALRHPTWQMGDRVTLDSATLMNKGFEVIEACHLFGVREDEVEVLVHPQSIVHSLVEFHDGSVMAQLGTADMRTPIQYALTYPERVVSHRMRLKLEEVGKLEFELPDLVRFPCLRLARDAYRAGGSLTAVLNAADEVAVSAFCAGEIGFNGIAAMVEETLTAFAGATGGGDDLEVILQVDEQARSVARAFVENRIGVER